MIGVNVKAPPVFLETQAPAGYIPGIGRGALAFTTRSDIGSASGAAQPGAPGSGVVVGAGKGVTAATGMQAARAAGAAAAAAAAGRGGGGGGGGGGVFDKFSGYSERLFSDTPYDADDAEADKVYAEVDAHMEERTRKRKAAREAEEAARARLQTSRIADTLVDVKRELATVSREEWEALPEIGDRSLRYKRKASSMSYTPVTDSVIEAGRAEARLGAMGALEARGGSGAATPAAAAAAAAGGLTDIRGLAEARGQMLSIKLDRMSDSVSGQTVVDPKGYLTSMASANAGSLLGGGGAGGGVDVADLKKARLLLQSVITTNPRHGPGWIAAARLEEQARNLAEARRLIREGCERCPSDEDVWLEAVRMQPPAGARIVLADAVKALPHSVKLWLAAADLEASADARRAVLHKALSLTPASEKLWKAAVSLEAPDDARIMLARAVECVPKSVDLWLALARLESYENAQRVLNQARAALPSEAAVWVAAAQLEEAAGHVDVLPKILSRALKSFAAQQVAMSRDAWVRAAEEAERAAAPATAAAIITATAALDVEEVDRRRTWLADAAALEERGSIACARAMHAQLLAGGRDREALWQRAAEFEKRHGTPAAVDALLGRAVVACPAAEVLWLMAAKERWVGGDVAGARALLQTAFATNPNSEAIWLAAAKLEWENDEVERAAALLARARDAAPSARVWMKSALLERQRGDAAAQERLLLEGVTRWPAAPKLWLMLAQLYDTAGLPDRARDAYTAGLRACPTATPLWLGAARHEERTAGATRARPLLEASRLRNAANPELWLESVRLERRAGNDKVADALLARALAECPRAGRLLAEDIATAPRAAQKRKAMDSVKLAEADAHVVLAVARLFWSDRKYAKARRWYNRAVGLDADLGDGWAALYAFELTHGTPATAAAVEARCAAADPHHGELWQRVAKRIENRRLPAASLLKAVALEMRRDASAAALFEQEPAALPAGTGDDDDGDAAPAGGATAGAPAAAAAAAPAATVAPTTSTAAT